MHYDYDYDNVIKQDAKSVLNCAHTNKKCPSFELLRYIWWFRTRPLILWCWVWGFNFYSNWLDHTVWWWLWRLPLSANKAWSFFFPITTSCPLSLSSLLNDGRSENVKGQALIQMYKIIWNLRMGEIAPLPPVSTGPAFFS